MRSPTASPSYVARTVDRVIAALSPAWALRRQRARAVLRFEAARADPERLRWIDGRPWTRIDGPPNAPERIHWEPLDGPAAADPPATMARWRPSNFWTRPSELPVRRG